MKEPVTPKDIYTIIILVIMLFLSAFLLSKSLSNNLHACNWEDCDLTGQEMNHHTFKSTWGYEEMTDGYLVELTHFMNPEMTYEQCEDYVFAGVE